MKHSQRFDFIVTYKPETKTIYLSHCPLMGNELDSIPFLDFDDFYGYGVQHFDWQHQHKKEWTWIYDVLEVDLIVAENLKEGIVGIGWEGDLRSLPIKSLVHTEHTTPRKLVNRVVDELVQYCEITFKDNLEETKERVAIEVQWDVDGEIKTKVYEGVTFLP